MAVSLRQRRHGDDLRWCEAQGLIPGVERDGGGQPVYNQWAPPAARRA